jgi:hypothetical protein
MAKCSFLLGLMTGLLVLLSRTIAVEMNDIFTVQPGTRDGGCDDRAAVLDQWLEECIQSIYVTLQAMDQYEQQTKVRRALSTIFGIANRNRMGGRETARGSAFFRIKGTCGPFFFSFYVSLHHHLCIIVAPSSKGAPAN